MPPVITTLRNGKYNQFGTAYTVQMQKYMLVRKEELRNTLTLFQDRDYFTEG